MHLSVWMLSWGGSLKGSLGAWTRSILLCNEHHHTALCRMYPTIKAGFPLDLILQPALPISSISFPVFSDANSIAFSMRGSAEILSRMLWCWSGESFESAFLKCSKASIACIHTQVSVSSCVLSCRELRKRLEKKVYSIHRLHTHKFRSALLCVL